MGGVICSRPSKWGNPFTGEDAAKMHLDWLQNTPSGAVIAELAAKELKDKALGCFCPLDKPCHIDNLILAAEGKL